MDLHNLILEQLEDEELDDIVEDLSTDDEAFLDDEDDNSNPFQDDEDDELPEVDFIEDEYTDEDLEDVNIEDFEDEVSVKQSDNSEETEEIENELDAIDQEYHMLEEGGYL